MSDLIADFFRGSPPPWVSNCGKDRFGPFIEFTVTAGDSTATQRLRWIPPGTFVMGSPESDVVREDDEGPQHEVRLTQGFWLFDTPCRQSLYEALLGENPSEFKDLERPVEAATWHEAVEFCNRLAALLAGPGVRLPTEAEWEYACRAGSTTAIYTGDLKMVGCNNSPALDAIAWYGGNSGADFDLNCGRDSSRWPEKQYQHTSAGSRKAGRKLPNRWGLYDMLGNVWDWCLDGKREYSKEAAVDPRGPDGADEPRVVRGGGWGSFAHDVRSAYRYAIDPEDRAEDLGFRCVLVQEVWQEGATDSLAERVSRRDATKRRARSPKGK